MTPTQTRWGYSVPHINDVNFSHQTLLVAEAKDSLAIQTVVSKLCLFGRSLKEETHTEDLVICDRQINALY